MLGEELIACCPQFVGIPYQLEPPPDGVTTLDCSLFVLKVCEAAGIPLSGVRTAEQIRQATLPLDPRDARPGDLLFFERTYDAAEPVAPDGHLATHIGFSLGRGTFMMWDCREPLGAQQTNIASNYWQEHIFEIRRHAQVEAPAKPALVHAIDVSNYQPQAGTIDGLNLLLGSLEPRPTHVVVRMPLSVERDFPEKRRLAISQIAAADALSCTVGAYVWAYGSVDHCQTVREAVGVMESSVYGHAPRALAFDFEAEDDVPSQGWIRLAGDECVARGVQPIAYSRKEWWNRHYPTLSLPGWWLWDALYQDQPDLTRQPYGSMQLVGHQYADTPLDRNVFLPMACA